MLDWNFFFGRATLRNSHFFFKCPTFATVYFIINSEWITRRGPCKHQCVLYRSYPAICHQFSFIISNIGTFICAQFYLTCDLVILGKQSGNKSFQQGTLFYWKSEIFAWNNPFSLPNHARKETKLTRRTVVQKCIVLHAVGSLHLQNDTHNFDKSPTLHRSLKVHAECSSASRQRVLVHFARAIAWPALSDAPTAHLSTVLRLL